MAIGIGKDGLGAGVSDAFFDGPASKGLGDNLIALFDAQVLERQGDGVAAFVGEVDGVGDKLLFEEALEFLG